MAAGVRGRSFFLGEKLGNRKMDYVPGSEKDAISGNSAAKAMLDRNEIGVGDDFWRVIGRVDRERMSAACYSESPLDSFCGVCVQVVGRIPNIECLIDNPSWLYGFYLGLRGIDVNEGLASYEHNGSAELLLNGTIDNHEAQLMEYRCFFHSPIWQSIYRFLDNRVWHATDEKGYSAICSSREIRPSGSKETYRQYPTICSYGVTKGFLCLFDFRPVTEEQLIRQWQNVCDIITEGPRYLFCIDPSRLAEDLIPNSQDWNNGSQGIGCIPFVESWYADTIPLSAVANVYKTRRSETAFDFEAVKIS